MKSQSIGKACLARMNTGKSILAALVAAALVSGATASASGMPFAAQKLQRTPVPEAVANGQATHLGAMAETRSLKLALVLPLHDEAGLDSLLQRLQDPRSADYHNYLTNDEFTARFGASQADYDAVLAWAKANGLTVTQTTSNRRVVDVAGSIASINRALHVRMGNYRHPADNRLFFAPDREPTTDLRVPLLAITGLTNATPRINHLRHGDPIQHMDAITRAHGSGPGGAYLPSDMRAAYYGSGPLTGHGQRVGIFSYDGYKKTDVTLFYTRTGMTSSVPVKDVLVNGYSGVCDNGDGSGTTTCDDGEQVLDIVNVIGMAPGLTQVLFYEGESATDILNQMATDNKAKIFSCSWGGGDFDNVADDVIYKQFAAQGQTFLNATGDDGAYNQQTWIDPSLDPNILDVGGTDLVVTGPGGAWVSEKGWTGSSGGYYKPAGELIPAYQLLPGVISTLNKASKTLRNDPDVSAEANYDNPTVSNGEFQTGWGGTSFAAPRWAGLLALANEQSVAAGTRALGFVNTKIYAIGLGVNYTTQFHDIKTGNNAPDLGHGAGFNAVANFDLVTGWGSPIGAAFINALTAH